MAIRSTHKGDRDQILVRVDRVIYNIIRSHSKELGIPMSQISADALAQYFGHPELTREFTREKPEGLPLAI